MKKIFLSAAAGLAMVAAGQVQAQSSDESAGYFALHATPIGALAPVAPNLGRQATAFRGHYGRHDLFGNNTNTFAVGADFPAGLQSSFGFTLGWRNIQDGDDHFMVGSQLAGNLMGGMPPGRIPPEGARLAIGYKAELGYGRANDTDLLGAALSVPFSVPVASGQTRITPFISPGLGWGRMSADGDAMSSVRFMVGGGLGLEMAGGTGLHIGARHIAHNQSEIQYGVGVTLRPR
jgi:hypothetical protein